MLKTCGRKLNVMNFVTLRDIIFICYKGKFSTTKIVNLNLQFKVYR